MSLTFADFDISVDGSVSASSPYVTCPRCLASLHEDQSHRRYLAVNRVQGTWQCTNPTCDWHGTLAHGQRPGAHAKRAWAMPAPGNGVVSAQLHAKYARKGIPATVVARHHVTMTRAFFPELDREADCVCFSYVRDGSLVTRRYMTRDQGEEVSQFEVGCERIFYNLDSMGGTTLVITSREVDVMALEEAGYTSVIGVPPTSDAVRQRNLALMFSFLDTMKERLLPFTRILLAVDTDAAGQSMAEELARRLGPERCWRVAWTDGATQANEVLTAGGAAGVQACLAAATPWPVEGILTVDDLSPALERLYLEGEQPGLTLGWPGIDPFFRIKQGEFSVITGHPTHGKSIWMNQVMIRTAQLYGWRWTVFSPENYPLERYLSFLVAQYMHKPFVGSQRLSFPELCEAEAWLHEHFTFLLPHNDEDSPQLDDILALAQIQVERRGIQGFLIDPWNELDHNFPARMTEQQYISESLSKVRRFARHNNVFCGIVAHPKNMERAKSGAYVGKFGPPTAHDVFGGSMWRNKADNILCIWRDEDDAAAPVELHSQKIRFQSLGYAPGVGYLRFEKSTGTYVDLGQMY